MPVQKKVWKLIESTAYMFFDQTFCVHRVFLFGQYHNKDNDQSHYWLRDTDGKYGFDETRKMYMTVILWAFLHKKAIERMIEICIKSTRFNTASKGHVVLWGFRPRSGHAVLPFFFLWLHSEANLFLPHVDLLM